MNWLASLKTSFRDLGGAGTKCDLDTKGISVNKEDMNDKFLVF